MWWVTQKTHDQSVSSKSRDTKKKKQKKQNHQSKIKLQERINNGERERDHIFWNRMWDK